MFDKLRKDYHKTLCESILKTDANGVPSNSDKHSDISDLPFDLAI